MIMICGEILADLIRNNENIKGITMYDIVNILSQFADDTNMFLTYDKLTFDSVVETLDIVQRNTVAATTPKLVCYLCWLIT